MYRCIYGDNFTFTLSIDKHESMVLLNPCNDPFAAVSSRRVTNDLGYNTNCLARIAVRPSSAGLRVGGKTFTWTEICVN